MGVLIKMPAQQLSSCPTTLECDTKVITLTAQLKKAVSQERRDKIYNLRDSYLELRYKLMEERWSTNA